jgi:peptide-methionine (R)-S-oxide reductase
MFKRHAEPEAAIPAEVEKPADQWQAELAPEQYQVLRCSATERAFTGRYWNTHTDGMYHCAGCDAALFSSDTKFDSGTGWPSFSDAAVADAVTLHRDRAMFMERVEVRCRKCGGHLGHLFDDGPGPTHQRYCINSAALELKETEAGKA